MHSNPHVAFDHSDIDCWLMPGPDDIEFPSDTAAELDQRHGAKAQLVAPSRNTDSASKQKASNRRCQQRYRQKKKVRTDSLAMPLPLSSKEYLESATHVQVEWQKLQDELAGAKAALKQMQSQRTLSNDANRHAHQVALSQASIVHVPWQVGSSHSA